MCDFIRQQVKFSLDIPSESSESQNWYTKFIPQIVQFQLQVNL